MAPASGIRLKASDREGLRDRLRQAARDVGARPLRREHRKAGDRQDEGRADEERNSERMNITSPTG